MFLYVRWRCLSLSPVQTALDRERRAHQSAVQKYVHEVNERSKMQLELEDRSGQLNENAIAMASVVAQRDELKRERDGMEAR